MSPRLNKNPSLTFILETWQFHAPTSTFQVEEEIQPEVKVENKDGSAEASDVPNEAKEVSADGQIDAEEAQAEAKDAQVEAKDALVEVKEAQDVAKDAQDEAKGMAKKDEGSKKKLTKKVSIVKKGGSVNFFFHFYSTQKHSSSVYFSVTICWFFKSIGWHSSANNKLFRIAKHPFFL